MVVEGGDGGCQLPRPRALAVVATALTEPGTESRPCAHPATINVVHTAIDAVYLPLERLMANDLLLHRHHGCNRLHSNHLQRTAVRVEPGSTISAHRKSANIASTVQLTLIRRFCKLSVKQEIHPNDGHRPTQTNTVEQRFLQRSINPRAVQNLAADLVDTRYSGTRTITSDHG